ncbi:lipoxygenase homology domain-containing protein 1-like [Engraulis encrasicolus]|uniref:lipoxygenase homology domain-containing protein 1-like n=1 Tax=Engraulis encrasicolus TaxID=184585 RepID=UPI002FD56455
MPLLPHHQGTSGGYCEARAGRGIGIGIGIGNTMGVFDPLIVGRARVNGQAQEERGGAVGYVWALPPPASSSPARRPPEEPGPSQRRRRRKEKRKDKPAEEDEGDGVKEEKEKKKKKKKSSKTDDKEGEENMGSKDEKKKKKKKNQLLNYQTESSDDYEDEYYKKKVYEVVTVTGDVKGGGTDANVFVTLFGEYGVTPKVHLASKSRNAFEKNKTDVFRIKTHNVGAISKIRIEHDNTGMNAGWYLDRVVITDMSRPHLRFFFSCMQWLSREEADGLIFRDLLGSTSPMDLPKCNKYMVSVFTADIKGSGTDADVFLTIFGEKGDSGERKLFSKDKDCFERAAEDKFILDAPNIGRIQRIMIGHNNKGGSAGWVCNKVTIDDIGNKEVYELPFNDAWFDISEGDGKIQRDALVGATTLSTGITYNVKVMTGDVRGAGTNSKIHLVMYGKKGMTNSGKVFLEGGTFERAQTDIFNVEICTLISPLSRVTIGHANVGISCGWHCEKVTVYCPFTGIEQVFPCSQWLDEDEGDGLVERELYEMVSLRQRKQIKHPWSVWIWTSDIKGAGTDAQVFVQLFGEKGKSDEFPLESKSDSFESGQIDKFMVDMPDLGQIRKLRIWHEKRNPFSGWHLNRVTAMNTLTKQKYKFACGRWLDINEDDQEIIRELPATGPLVPEPLPLIKYRVTICTGMVSGSGTDASVYLCIFGDLGDTGERLMFQSQNNANKFEKGNHDEFLVEAVTLGQVRRVRIGHDGRGGGCGWFLDKVMVREEGTPESSAVVFPCNRWLDRGEDDGLIIRELCPTDNGQRLFNVKYHIAIRTGSINGASSDSKVFVKLYGEKGDTMKTLLLVSENDLSNYFETGQIDTFILETYDIGQIKRLLIGHTNEGLKAGWFLDSVLISVPVHGTEYMFPAHRWLSTNEADGKVEVEIYPSETLEIEKLINYEVTVLTGDVFAAGTNARVFIQIYGLEGKTEVLRVSNRSNNFERGTTEIFAFEAHDVGRVFKIRIGHDGSGAAPGWFLESVHVRRLIMALVPIEKKEEEEEKIFAFTCSRWLARDEEDGEIVVELRADDYDELEENTYEIHVFTGTMFGAGTDAKVFVNLYGESADTGERHLRKSAYNLNKFERGQEDVFVVKAIDLGPLKKLRIRHDNTNAGPAWFLDRVEVVDTKEEVTYYFPCMRWLAVDEDDGQLARELVPVDEAFMHREEEEDEDGVVGGAPTLGLEQKAMTTTFNVSVRTGDKKYGGTDANVYAILYGSKDDTGIIKLKASKTHKNKFEVGMIDEFTVEAVDLGQLKKLRIGHDNSGGSPGWFLDWVEVDAPSLGEKLVFPCGRWLDRGKEDGAIFRDLHPNPLQTETYTPYVPYEIKIYTSDIFAAGTDADVFIVLYGSDGVCTTQKSLCLNKRERTLSFKRGAEDMFIIELEDIGDIIDKIRIGHDNRGTNPGWHLDRVEIRRLLRKGKGSETTIFYYDAWLATSEEDGEIIRELVPADVITEKLAKDGTLRVTEIEIEDALEVHTYRVVVRTGDVYGAGTDANVFLTIYGDLGDTGERQLSTSNTNSNKFERGSLDEFNLEAVDLGQVYKIRIRHDNSLMSPEWYLEDVEIIDTDTEEDFIFLCERWLSMKREDHCIDRIFYVKGYDGPRGDSALPGLDSNMNEMKSEDEEDAALLIPYHFMVITGDEDDAGTNSRAFVIIHGREECTERMWLDMPEGKSGFEPDAMDTFSCLGADVGDIKQVEFGHDGASPESCWLVMELAVDVPTKGVKLVFRCKCWLAKDRGDGLTTRVLNVMDAEMINIKTKVIYEITVGTGDVQYGGTDSHLYLTAFGANGSSSEMLLPKNGDRFERGQEDTFTLEIEEIAPLRMIRVRSDGTGSRPDWFLERVVLRNLSTEEVAEFTCGEWLSLTMGTKKSLSAEMPAIIDDEQMVELTEYTITVKTGEAMAAGTDANVWCMVFGENGDTGVLALKHSQNGNKFERKKTDVFKFPEKLSLGDLSKVRLWHDNSGPAPGWFLDFVEVRDELMDQTFRFPCRKWLAKSEDDGQLMRELGCANNDILDLDEKTKYEIVTVTADDDDAETKENVTIILEGRKGRSKVLDLENSGKKRRFLSGSEDRFEFSSKNVGDIAGICVGHVPKDGKKPKGEAYWHVVEIIVTEIELGNKFFFNCNAQIPLQSKRDDPVTFELSKMVESFASKARSLVPVRYEIIVVTGDEKGAGTDANVFMTVFGTNGDSGRRQLRKRFQNNFERDKTERFNLELLEMGDLTHVIMEHDNKGLSPGWLLERVEITNTANAVTTIFHCGKWLDKKKADGKTRRTIYPKY